MLLGIPDPGQCYWIFQSDPQCPKLILVPSYLLGLTLYGASMAYRKKCGRADMGNTCVEGSSHPKIAYTLLTLSAVLPVILLHGVIDEFTFKHVGIAIDYDLRGHIPEENLKLGKFYVPGFYILTVEISKICNIPYDTLPFLFISLIPFIFLLFSIYNNINNNKIICSIIVLIATTYSLTSNFLAFWVHGIGFLLFLTVILSTIILYQSNNINTRAASFLIIILSVLSVNYMSYKATFWVLSFLLSFAFIEWFEYYIIKSNYVIKSARNLRSFKSATLIGVILTLSFNKFIYNSFIPTVKVYHEFTIGAQKIFSMLHSDPSDPLNHLYYSFPSVVTYITFMRIVLISLILFLVIIKIIKIISTRDIEHFNLTIHLFIALLLIGTANFFIYNLLGLFDLVLLTHAGFIALLAFYKYNMKKLAYAFIIALVVMNVIYQTAAYTYSVAPKDVNHFEYIKPSVNWYISYGIGMGFELRTDELTKGYYIKELADERTLNYPISLYGRDVLFIIQECTMYNPSTHTFYVINCKEPYFSVENWNVLKSLGCYSGAIESNLHLNKIYTTSSKISIYYVN
ncbi:MAG: hypothetical protein U9N61_03320 [Euryarchaeota archaeon]|nr:hypothetical protein [Euryarchaeota archaeon]